MKNELECVFCGARTAPCTRKTNSIESSEVGIKFPCSRCSDSIGAKEPKDWFRWLRHNDHSYWIKIVDNHRLGSCDIAKQIRRVRIE